MKNKKKNKDEELIEPINQINLYGYKKYFDLLTNLYKSKRLPNSILLTGPKGIGKATFAYHFINSILSENEDKNYLCSDFKINVENSTYNKIINNIHPNFFSVNNDSKNDQIKIEQIRLLIKFLNKSTYSKNLKLVLIDNLEYLNLNSNNALLKAIEEPSHNTFFILIQDSSFKVFETIKSRCVEFKIHFSKNEKKYIFENLLSFYNDKFNEFSVFNDLFYLSPGELLKYFLFLRNLNINTEDDILITIEKFLDSYLINKNREYLSVSTFLIEKFYNELSFNNDLNINLYFNNCLEILKKIDCSKKFNLNEKNTIMWVKEVLHAEKR